MFKIKHQYKTQIPIQDSSKTKHDPDHKSYWPAASNGDLGSVKAAIEAGVEVDSKTNYGATALFFACDRDQKKVVDYLLSKGADPNSQDTFYKATPLGWAQMEGHEEIVLSLLRNGGESPGNVLFNARRARTSSELKIA